MASKEKVKSKPRRYRPTMLFVLLTCVLISGVFFQALAHEEPLPECQKRQPFSTTTWYPTELGNDHIPIDRDNAADLAPFAQVELAPPQIPNAYFSPDSQTLAVADLVTHPETDYPYYMPETALWKFGQSSGCFLQMSASFVDFTNDNQHVYGIRLIPCEGYTIRWPCAAFISIRNGDFSLQWYENSLNPNQKALRQAQVIRHNPYNDLSISFEGQYFYILQDDQSPIAAFPVKGKIKMITFSPDGKWIAVTHSFLCEHCSGGMPYGYVDLWGIPSSDWKMQKIVSGSNFRGEQRQ